MCVLCLGCCVLVCCWCSMMIESVRLTLNTNSVNVDVSISGLFWHNVHIMYYYYVLNDYVCMYIISTVCYRICWPLTVYALKGTTMNIYIIYPRAPIYWLWWLCGHYTQRNPSMFVLYVCDMHWFAECHLFYEACGVRAVFTEWECVWAG